MLRQLVNVTRTLQLQRPALSSRSAIILPATYTSEYKRLLDNKRLEDDKICKDDTKKLVKEIQKIIHESIRGKHVPPFDERLFESDGRNRHYTFYNNKLYFGGLLLNCNNFNELTGVNYFDTSLNYALYQLGGYDVDMMNPDLARTYGYESVFDALDQNAYTPELVEQEVMRGSTEVVVFGIDPDNIDRLMEFKE